MELHTILGLIVSVSSSQLGISLDKQLLARKFEESSEEKDRLFEQRETQLREIIKEIKKFEKATKDNANMVDNMIVP